MDERRTKQFVDRASRRRSEYLKERQKRELHKSVPKSTMETSLDKVINAIQSKAPELQKRKPVNEQVEDYINASKSNFKRLKYAKSPEISITEQTLEQKIDKDLQEIDLEAEKLKKLFGNDSNEISKIIKHDSTSIAQSKNIIPNEKNQIESMDEKKRKYEEKVEQDFFANEAQYQEEIKRKVENYLRPSINAKKAGNVVTNIRPKSDDFMKAKNFNYERQFPYASEEAKTIAEHERYVNEDNRIQPVIAVDEPLIPIDYQKEQYHEDRWEEARTKETLQLEEEERLRKTQLGSLHYPIGTAVSNANFVSQVQKRIISKDMQAVGPLQEHQVIIPQIITPLKVIDNQLGKPLNDLQKNENLNLNFQNDSKKNPEMAHLLAGAALGSLFSQASALPQEEKRYTQAEKDANTHPNQGSNDVDDFLYSARHMGKNGFAKALKLLGQTKSEEEIKDILSVAKGVLEQSKGKAGLISMLDVALNQRNTMSPNVTIKKHIAEITSRIKLNPNDQLMQADKQLDDTDLKSLTATGLRKVDVAGLFGVNKYTKDEYGYDAEGEPVTIKRKTEDAPTPAPKKAKTISDPEAGPATGNAADPTMPKAGPQWSVPSIPKPISMPDETVFYKAGQGKNADVFGLDSFQGAKEMKKSDFYTQFPQYRDQEMLQGIRFRDDQGKVTKEAIGTKILDADKRVYLKMDNYGTPLAHSDTPFKIPGSSAYTDLVKDSVAGASILAATIASQSIPAVGIPMGMAGLNHAYNMFNAPSDYKYHDDYLSGNVPHPSITYDPNTGYSMPFKEFKQQYANQDYSPYEAGPELFEIPNPNIGQPVYAPPAPNDANVFDSMNINPEKEPEYDPFRQAASMAWNGALNTGQILAAGYIGSTMGPMGGILFNHALNGMMSSLGKYDPGKGFQKSQGQSGQNTDASNVVYDLTKQYFKKEKKEESSDKVMEQAPQILNPMTVQAENQRVGATVLNAFSQGQVARSQVSETAKGYQNFYRDSMTPFAIDLPQVKDAMGQKQKA